MSELKYEDIAIKALALPEDERLRLAGDLLASVPPPPGILSLDDPGAIEEIKRRCDEIDSGTAELLDGEIAIRRLRETIRATKHPDSN